MFRKAPLVLVTLVIGVFGFAAPSAAAPMQLLLSQSAAFSILGHSCGGIQEQVFTTGFDQPTGNPVGVVYMSTRCGGSGRGGGYHTTMYSAWATVTWSFAGATLSYSIASPAPTVNSTFSAYDGHGDQVYNQNNQAYLVVLVPAAPTNVTATPSAGQFQVAWTPDPSAPPALITSSTVTATPLGFATAPAVTNTVTGNGASALLGPLQPQTTYQISVLSTDAAGSGPPSGAVTVTTGASALLPGAPTNVKARWTAPGSPGDTLVATWNAAPAGDSPTDQYQITITGSDGGGTFSQNVSGSTLSATFAVSDVPDWKVQVRAHDAAGWSPWSISVRLGGA
jgi:hypothetical protein